jgi:hypothetical protein
MLLDWIAAVAVLVCLVALAVDFWDRPRRYVDPRSPVTWGVVGLLVLVAVVVNVVD